MVEQPEHHFRRDLHDLRRRQSDLSPNEISPDTFLRNMSRDERNGLAYLFGEVLKKFDRYSSSAVFGVGTLTFPNSYWDGLEKFVSEDNASLKDITGRRGEDIDLIIVNEFLRATPLLFIKYFKGLLRDVAREGNISYVYSEEKRESGAGYIKLPNQTTGRKEVLRSKSIAYSGPNFIISIGGCRKLHISLEGSQTIDEKLTTERIYGRPFSFLGRFRDILDSIHDIKMAPGLFDQNTTPSNQWLEDKAKGIIEQHKRAKRDMSKYTPITLIS